MNLLGELADRSDPDNPANILRVVGRGYAKRFGTTVCDDWDNRCDQAYDYLAAPVCAETPELSANASRQLEAVAEFLDEARFDG